MPPPVKLEFEKVYCPYLLMTKKRYAGLLWTRPEKYDKMDTKGIESVRRDNCLLVRRVVTTSLEKLLIQRDIEGAVKYVKGTISDLLMNRLDLSELVVSKVRDLLASGQGNRVRLGTVERRWRLRDQDCTRRAGKEDAEARSGYRTRCVCPSPAQAVDRCCEGIGDRVPYVIIKAAKGAKAYEKAEDPIFALEHNLPIDFQHYVDHHLSQPIVRIFEPILKERVKELLNGEHTRSVIVSTPSAASGGIMRFVKTCPKCLGCKAPLDEVFATLCKHCEPDMPRIYVDHLAKWDPPCARHPSVDSRAVLG